LPKSSVLVVDKRKVCVSLLSFDHLEVGSVDFMAGGGAILVRLICLVASHDRWVHDDAGQNGHGWPSFDF
jgi:hypothetical protein